MLFTLLAAALAHAPVNETLERLDVSVAEEARRSAHLHLHQQRATDALAVLHADDHSPEAELLRAEAGILLGRPDARSRLDRLLDTAPRRVQARALDLRAGLHTDPIAAWNDVAQAVLLEATPDRSLQAAALAPNPPAALAILAHSRDKLGPSVSIDHALSRAWLAVDAPESALAVLSGTTGQTTEGRLLRADALEQAGRGEAALDLRSELLADLDAALAGLGMGTADRHRAYELLGAVMHINAVEFVAGQGRKGCRVESESDGSPVVLAASLLGCKVDLLVRALCYRTVSLGGEAVTVPLAMDKAAMARSLMAAALYARVVDWVLARINSGLDAIIDALPGRGRSAAAGAGGAAPTTAEAGTLIDSC